MVQDTQKGQPLCTVIRHSKQSFKQACHTFETLIELKEHKEGTYLYFEMVLVRRIWLQGQWTL